MAKSLLSGVLKTCGQVDLSSVTFYKLRDFGQVTHVRVSSSVQQGSDPVQSVEQRSTIHPIVGLGGLSGLNNLPYRRHSAGVSCLPALPSVRVWAGHSSGYPAQGDLAWGGGGGGPVK